MFEYANDVRQLRFQGLRAQRILQRMGIRVPEELVEEINALHNEEKVEVENKLSLALHNGGTGAVVDMIRSNLKFFK